MKMLTVMIVIFKIESSQRSLFLCVQNLRPQFKKVRLLVNGLLASMKQKRIKLYVSCLLKRFLKDEKGDIESVERRCFKLNIGSSTVMEDTPDHLPDIFKIYDVIDGPLNVLPMCRKKYVPDYDSVFHHFQEVSHLSREYMKNMS